MTDQMPSDASNTNTGNDASQPAEGQAPFAHDVLYGNSEQAQSNDQQNVVEKTTDVESKSDEQQSEDTAEAAYEFKPPEGKQYDPDTIKGFEEIAKETKIAPKDAQKILDKMGPLMEAKQAKFQEQVKQAWIEAVVTDKEIGGDKLSASLEVAKKAVTAFGPPEFGKWLSDSGLGNHPVMIKLLYNVGKNMSGDRYVGQTSTASVNPKSMGFNDLANALYSNQSN